MDANDVRKKGMYDAAMDALSGVPLVYGNLCGAFKPLVADSSFKTQLIALLRQLQSASTTVTQPLYDTAVNGLGGTSPGVERFCHALVRLDWVEDSAMKIGVVKILDRLMTPDSPPPLAAKAVDPEVDDLSEFEIPALTDEQLAEMDRVRANRPVQVG